MNSAAEEKITHEEYEYANNEDVMTISDRLLTQHKEAYTALANA